MKQGDVVNVKSEYCKVKSDVVNVKQGDVVNVKQGDVVNVNSEYCRVKK